MVKHFIPAVLIIFSSVGYAQELKPQDLYKKTLPSVMTLSVKKQDGSGATGSAFLAIKDGLAVTAWHVVNGAKYVVAKFSDGEEFEVSGVVDKDERRDIAVVRVKVFGRPLLPLVSGDPEIGSRAYVIGAPSGLEFSVSDGLLSQIQVFEGLKQYQFTCPASPGNSGGPLINSRGEAIGVVSWQVKEGQNLNFAVPANYVKGLDVSLATQPWGEVRLSAVSVAGSTSNDELDKLFAKAIIAMADVKTAMSLTSSIIRKSNGYRNGVPAYLYSTQRLFEETAKEVEAVGSSDPNRNTILTAVKSDCKYLQEATTLLIEALHTAQNNSGWGPQANDLLSRSQASLQLVGNPEREMKQLSNSKAFVETFPYEYRCRVGLAADSAGFKFGASTWVNNSLLFLDLNEKGLGYALGFQSGDIISSVNGATILDLQELKMLMKRCLGKRIKVLVSRYDESDQKRYDKELEIDVPQTLPSQ